MFDSLMFTFPLFRFAIQSFHSKSCSGYFYKREELVMCAVRNFIAVGISDIFALHI